MINLKWLEEKHACASGTEWFREKYNELEPDGIEPMDLLDSLIKNDKLQWANWFIVRIMTKMQYVKYAIFAAEQVIDIYEKKYPNNKKPRETINAAKKWVENPTEENRGAADAAAAYAYADAAAAAAYADAAAAYADAAAAYAAADADDAAAAAYAADAAADADAAAADAAADAAAADAAADAAAAARKEMRLKILNYGIGLLKG